MGYCLKANIDQWFCDGKFRSKKQSAKVQNDFEISQTDAFAAPGFHLALADSSI